MYRYYLNIDRDAKSNDHTNNDTPKSKSSPKLRLGDKSSDHKPISSPKTLKKNISNENFIKYQWAWTI